MTTRDPRQGDWSQDPAETLRALGLRVRELRVQGGFTQQELADRSGVHRVAVARIEAGSRDFGVTTLVDLAAALGVKPADLFGRNG